MADLDQDGLSEVLIGARGSEALRDGAVYLIREPAASSLNLSKADTVIRGESGELPGWSVHAAALTPDRPALLVGSQGVGAVARLTGESEDSYAGLGLGVGDVDGDGLGDLIVGAPLQDTGGTAAGAAYVLTGADTAR